MSKIDIVYLGLVLFAFIGFAAVLAYYSQTCADPSHRQRARLVGLPARAEPRAKVLRIKRVNSLAPWPELGD